MKAIITFFILSFLSFPYAHDWIPIGPDTVTVNGVYTSFSYDILLLSDGILLDTDKGWIKDSRQLPAWDIVELFPDTLIIAMGKGTRSDGIYQYVPGDSAAFEILYWTLNPHFIIKNPASNIYYAGSEQGLLRSANGRDWEEVKFFNAKNCISMSCYKEHLAVSVWSDSSGIFYSEDQGNTWKLSINQHHPIYNLTFDENGTLFGLLPGISYSSGLWRSDDYGNFWENEFYSGDVYTLGYTTNMLFIGWYPNRYKVDGIAMWDVLDKTLTFLDEGLPQKKIRKIVVNQVFDCPNVIACTDSGAYCLCQIPVKLQDDFILPMNLSVKNYPNPFNAKAVFDVELPERGYIDFSIYDVNGKHIESLHDGLLEAGHHQLKWHAGAFASGVYFYKLESNFGMITGKSILIK